MTKRSLLMGTTLLATTIVVSAQTSSNSAAGANAAASADQNGAAVQSSQSGAASTATHGGAAKGSAESNTSASADRNGNASLSLAEGSTIEAVLTKPVDSGKAKQGDEVVAKTTRDVKQGGTVLIAKGSRLVGHVTEASAKKKDAAESKLGIVFDRAVSKGREVPIHAALQAVVATQSQLAAASADDLSAPSSANAGAPGRAPAAVGAPVGGVLGGVGNTVGGVTRGVDRGVDSATGAVSGATQGVGTAAEASGQTATNLDGTLRGVSGLPGVTLNAASEGSSASTLTSSTRNVHLDSGTRLVLSVAGSATPQQ